MNRRELLKFCFAGTFFSGCLFDGLKKTVSGKEIPSLPPFKDCSIIPKQTDIYKILMPLPFNHKLIDEIADMNKTASKYKITGLYNSIPLPLGEKYELFQSGRGYNPDINSIDKYIEYCQHAKDIGINVIYCINSPNVLTKHEFDEINPDFENLIKRLTDSGIKKFKIANTQLLDILQGRPYDIEFQASTSFEYHNVNQYINLLQKHPYITTIDVAIDENKNFSFLASLKKLFPKINIELMVDEPCLRGCPARISHPASVGFCDFDCFSMRKKNPGETIIKSSIIYPWNLEYYSALGINSFKFFSRNLRANINNLDFCRDYLDIIENGIGNRPAIALNNMLGFSLNKKAAKIPLSEFKNYLPDVEFFIKNGYKCAVNCSVKCNYCKNIADNLKEYFV